MSLPPFFTSPWTNRLIGLAIDLAMVFYIAACALGSSPTQALVWASARTGMLSVDEAVRVGTVFEVLAPAVLAVMVGIFAFRGVRQMTGWQFPPRDRDNTLFFEKAWSTSAVRRDVVSGMAGRKGLESLRSADESALRDYVAGVLASAHVDPDVARVASSGLSLNCPLDHVRGGRTISAAVQQAALSALGRAIVLQPEESSGLSLRARMDFCDLLSARGYVSLSAGSLLPPIHLPSSGRHGAPTVEAYVAPEVWASALPPIIVGARHASAESERAMLELLLSACAVYSGGSAGLDISVANAYLKMTATRLSAIGFVPPEDFDAPGGSGISTPEDLRSWALDQVVSELSPLRTSPLDTVAVPA